MLKEKAFLIAVLFLVFNANIALASGTKIIINVPSKTLDLIVSPGYVKTYPVGVGRLQYPTPIGSFFSIKSKVKNPKWQSPYGSKNAAVIKAGIGNPLGTCWMGFHNHKQGIYGIHGTNNPQSVGKYSSHGCIRMKIPHAEEVFRYVNVGTPVKVNNYDYKVTVNSNEIRVKRHKTLYKKNASVDEMIKSQLYDLGVNYKLYSSSFADLKGLKVGQSKVIGFVVK